MRWLVVATLFLFSTADVRGHGRPPMTNGMHFTNDPATLIVPSTMGLLVSRDNGCTFHWVCEESIGYGDPFDPKYAAARDGSIFATTYTGLRISRDGGCSFTTATATLPVGDPNRIADIWIDALDLGPTGDVWVGTAGGLGTTNDIFASTDNGQTLTPRGLPSTTLAYNSVRVAPSDPARVYASGARQQQIGVFRLATGTWQELALTGVQLGTPPWITVAAVDRGDPDTFYIVSQGAAAGGGADRLYRSTDGGMTFAEVFTPAEGTIKDVFVRDAQLVYVTTLVRAGPTIIGGPAYASTDGAPRSRRSRARRTVVYRHGGRRQHVRLRCELDAGLHRRHEARRHDVEQGVAVRRARRRDPVSRRHRGSRRVRAALGHGADDARHERSRLRSDRAGRRTDRGSRLLVPRGRSSASIAWALAVLWLVVRRQRR